MRAVLVDAYNLLRDFEQFIDWSANERGRELFLVLMANLKMWEADQRLDEIDHTTAIPSDYIAVLETLETAMVHFNDADGVFAVLSNQNLNEPHADNALGIYDRAAAGLASAKYLEYRIRLLRNENNCSSGVCAYMTLCQARQYQLTSLDYLERPEGRLLGPNVQYRRYLTSLQIHVPLLTGNSICPADQDETVDFPEIYEAAYDQALQ